MLKFVVFLSAFAGVCFAAPGYLHESHGYPAAVSHSSRVDVFSKPIVTHPYLEDHHEHHYGLPLGYSSPSVSHSAHYSVHPPPQAYAHHGGGYGYGDDYGYGGADIHGVHSWL